MQKVLGGGGGGGDNVCHCISRILGLTVQDNMKWNEHVYDIVKKASKILYMLRLLKISNASIDTLIVVYIQL